MAGGDSSDCHIVPARGSNTFRLRVRLPSPEDGRFALSSSTTVAGRKCLAAFWPARTGTQQVRFVLGVSNCPVLEAAAKVSTHMVLLDKTGSPGPSIGTGETCGDVSVGPSFMARGYYTLEANVDDIKAICVVDKDGYFDVLCSVDIDWTPPASPLEEEELFPDLGHHLAIMSDKQEHTDVSFDVGGETFSAHRLVLAARSPVFKAELYGPMAEGKMTSITIQDMEASTFRSMLHYLYHGSLPNNVGKTEEVSSALVAAEHQHLLIAADRYGIERLKKICENKLCAEGITIDSVVSMLEFAEDHVCPKLKATCFDFLADGDNFKVVATSDEYLQLMLNFPSLFVEAQNRFKTPHEKPTITEPDAHKKSRLC
ncbi:hypothetical protein ACQ4PT_055782 [Festuca glaucescens]